jgi:hypothetical protein
LWGRFVDKDFMNDLPKDAADDAGVENGEFHAFSLHFTFTGF